MKGKVLTTVLSVGLGLLACLLLGRVVRHYETGGRLRVELGRLKITELSPETEVALAALRSEVFVSYYVSSPEHMPSHMRRVEEHVTDLLEAMRRAAPGQFDFQIVDPESDPDLAGFAARRRVSPFRVRSVQHDAYSERTVWSSLTISYGSHRDVVVRGIGPEQLPRLQATLIEHLRRLDDPRPPRIALSAGPGYSMLGQTLAELGDAFPVSLEPDRPLPFDSDLLFWMEPGEIDAARLRELDRFLEEGKSVLVAGALWKADGSSLVPVPESPGTPALEMRPGNYAAGSLLTHFGLRPIEGVLVDSRSDQVTFEDAAHAAPVLIRCIAPNQDFLTWKRQPNGTLLFTLPTPIALEAETLEQLGWQANVLATSSDGSRLLPAPGAGGRNPLPLSSALLEEGTAVAKQPLLVELVHRDPWRGRILFAASTSPFEDSLFQRPATAHAHFVKTLVGELASDERLVVSGARIARPAPLPRLGGGARTWWRIWNVFLVPGLLAVLGLLHHTYRKGLPKLTIPSGLRRFLPRFALVLAGVLALVLIIGKGLRLDATEEGLNHIAPETVALVEESSALDENALDVELYFSPRGEMPPDLRGGVARVRGLLNELERSGAKLSVRTARVEGLSDDERSRLAERGVHTFQVSTLKDEVTTVRSVYSTVVIDGEPLGFPDARSFESLEFRLAFALQRKLTGRRPHVAFASDVPRPSAAEAYEHYQQKGLFAPKGTDVYSIAREVLEGVDYRVTHVNPRNPVIPEDVDLLIWLQPRRSIEKMLTAAVRYLHGGGRVLLAVQHFNIQARQYRGADFDLVYWPQPQSPDVEHLYFPEIGIELVREVLFDELSTRLSQDTQLGGLRDGRTFERQESALPFLIRTAAANYAEDALLTRNLGDQAFIWGSYLRWDEERLAELGIRAETLIESSERTWSYDWRGRWLPDELLEAPAMGEDGEPLYLGRLPLAVRFEGTFPRPEKALRMSMGFPGADPSGPVPFDEGDEPWPESAPGELVLIGCSELFKDDRILEPEFRGDHLLLNAAASMVLDPDLARVATRRAVPRGFDLLKADDRMRWRVFVLAAGPLLFVAAGLLRLLLRRRSSPPPAPPQLGSGVRRVA